MRDERMLLREQVRAVRDQLHLLDTLLQDVSRRLRAMRADSAGTAYQDLLREQQLLAHKLTATLQEQQALASRYFELLRRLGQLGTTDDADDART